jgi:hypothetical protein
MNLSPLPIQKFFDNNGTPLTGGLLYTYVAGTTTKIATYTDSSGGTPNTNPVVLNFRGEANVWLDPTLTYKFTLAPLGDTDPPTKPIWTVDNIATGITLSQLTQQIIGQILWPRTAAETSAGVTPANYAYMPGDVRRYGAVGNGVADDTAALNNANLSWNGAGVVTFPGSRFTCLATSQIVFPTGISWVGQGVSEINGTGASNRGATCILRGFTGTSATLAINGDDCGITGIDVDNNLQGTGDCVQVWGGRAQIGALSCRNSGGDGLRIGRTNAGASSTNTNFWQASHVIVCGNAGAGMRVDDTNTTTSLSYPLGLSNANAGYCSLIDARSNGTDGLQIGNANDNVFAMVGSQSNTGCGIRFKTDGTNAGPRCNKILGNDCEANTGNDIQIDAATLPAAAPGLYNVVWGNRSVAVSSRIVDNSTGSLVMQWFPGLGFRAYQFGSDVNALSTTGNAGFNAYVGANNSPVRFYGVASGAVDGIARISVHKNGGAQTDGFQVNQNAVSQALNDIFTPTYSASITIDASTGHIFPITATNGVAFTINTLTNPTIGQRIQIGIRNNSGGAMGAVTWPANFKMTAWTNPANGFQRYLNVYYDGTNWIMYCATTNDVAL